MMQKINNPSDVFECLNNLSAALTRSLYASGTATQAQYHFLAKIDNPLYEAVQIYKGRWESKISSDSAYCLAAIEQVRQSIVVIESEEGKAFMESLPAPSRAIVECMVLCATTYLTLK